LTTEETNYITDEVKALIGKETEWSEYAPPIDPSEVRRFTQAIMDNDPIYWDEEFVKTTRYGKLVVPPLAVGMANRRKPGSPDPLEYLWENPEDDGTFRGWQGDRGRAGQPLPQVPIPFVRLVNGGTEGEFFQYASPGDRIRSKQKYADIRQRQGSTGPMVIITTETMYENEKGELLAIIRSTSIRR